MNRIPLFLFQIAPSPFISFLCFLPAISLPFNHAQGQNNLGFESGTFAGWAAATGQCCPVYAPTTGFDSTRHLITSGAGFDPYSNMLVPVTAAGSLFSSRLGNDNHAAESEILEYSFIVPDDSMLLKINYAVIQEDGLHPASKQPRFRFEVSSNGVMINECSEVQVLGGDLYPGKIKSGILEILPWQNSVINLFGYEGQPVTIRFETGDCSPGGHFGYAYIDGELIKVSASTNNCNPDGSVTLPAPAGLTGTWFNGSTSDSIIISNPMINSNYYFDVFTGSSCPVRINYTLDHLLPTVHFDKLFDCTTMQLLCMNNSISNAASVSQWYVNNNPVTNLWDLSYTIPGSGSYQLELLVTHPNGCRGTFRDSLVYEPLVIGSLLLHDTCTMSPANLDVVFISQGDGPLNFSWLINGSVVSNASNPVHYFSYPGSYPVTLIVTDGNLCADTAQSEIDIMEAFLCEALTYPPYVPNAFTPNGDGINDYFEIGQTDVLTGVELVVYNRFGQEIYRGARWNGNSNSGICQQGVYAYELTYTIHSMKRTQTGRVSLVR